MSKKFALSVAVLLAIGAAGALASTSTDLSRKTTLVVQVHLTKQVFRDLPPRGTSPGDLFLDRFTATRNGRRAGYGHEDCRATFPATKSRVELQCDEFLSLRGRGDITAQGVVHLIFAQGGPQPTAFAITGGTAQYQNVRGQITTRSVRHHEVWTLHLLP